MPETGRFSRVNLSAKDRRRQITRLIGRILVAAAALNLNGAFNMLFDVGQAVSFVFLIGSGVIIFLVGKAALSSVMLLFIATIASYLAFGGLFTRPGEAGETIPAFALTYGGTVLLVWALAAYFVNAERRGRWPDELKFTRNILVFSAALVWASPFLYNLYINVPLSMQYRMSGFFENPNEAGHVAAAGLALVITRPYGSRAMNIVAMFLCIGAVLQTFSKGAALIGLVFLSLGAVRWVRGYLRVVLTASVALAMIVVVDAKNVSERIAEQKVIELNIDQQRRVLQFGALLSGDVSASVTTGRSAILDESFETIIASQPFGNGLDSMHHIRGGILEHGVWQGIHNTFLMIFGEAGFIPGLLFLWFFVYTGWMICTRRSIDWEMYIYLLLFLIFVSNHNSLSLRFVNLFLAMIIASLALSTRRVRVR